jgi:hypothetical protein
MNVFIMLLCCAGHAGSLKKTVDSCEAATLAIGLEMKGDYGGRFLSTTSITEHRGLFDAELVREVMSDESVSYPDSNDLIREFSEVLFSHGVDVTPQDFLREAQLKHGDYSSKQFTLVSLIVRWLENRLRTADAASQPGLMANLDMVNEEASRRENWPELLLVANEAGTGLLTEPLRNRTGEANTAVLEKLKAVKPDQSLLWDFDNQKQRLEQQIECLREHAEIAAIQPIHLSELLGETTVRAGVPKAADTVSDIFDKSKRVVSVLREAVRASKFALDNRSRQQRPTSDEISAVVSALRKATRLDFCSPDLDDYMLMLCRRSLNRAELPSQLEEVLTPAFA